MIVRPAPKFTYAPFGAARPAAPFATFVQE